MMRLCVPLLIVCFAPLSFGVALTLAQDTLTATSDQTPATAAPSNNDPLALEEAGNGAQYSFAARSKLAFRTDVKGTDADVMVSHSGLNFGLRQELTDRLTILADISFEFSYFDFGGGELVAGVSDPFHDLYSIGGLVTLNYGLDDQWSVFGTAFLGVAGEAGADVGDSVLGGGGGGVGWRPSEWFRMSVGLAVRSRLEDDAIVTPLINFSWRLNETMRLESRSLPQGGGVGLTWELNDEADFTLFGGVEYRQWRLDGGSGELRDGVVRDLRVPLGAALFWKAAPGFTLEVEGGAIVYQEYEFLDKSGDRIEDLESELTPFVGVRLKWSF